MLSYSCLSCKRQAKVNIVHAQVNKKMCGHSGVVMVPEAVPEKLEPITLCFEGSRTMKTTVANSKTVINPQCTHVQRLLRKCVSDRLSVCLSVTTRIWERLLSKLRTHLIIGSQYVNLGTRFFGYPSYENHSSPTVKQ